MSAEPWGTLERVPPATTLLDTRARARLTGAVVVVAIIVLAVPELLRGPGPHSQVSVHANPAPAAHAPERQPSPISPQSRLPVAHAQPVALRAPPAAALPVPAPRVPVRTHSEPAPVRSREHARPRIEPGRREWTVQVGSFAERANAQRLARRLGSEGFRMEVSVIHVAGRRLYRVRASEKDERAKMEVLAERLRSAGQIATVLPR